MSSPRERMPGPVAPFEVPEEYSSLYNFSDDGLNTFNGMVSVVDEAVGNITDALRGRGVWENTLIVYFHDNGAPLGGGGSNYPLRGGKVRHQTVPCPADAVHAAG